jgi:uncharacterized coiled-coil DUF342 family protein
MENLPGIVWPDGMDERLRVLAEYDIKRNTVLLAAIDSTKMAVHDDLEVFKQQNARLHNATREDIKDLRTEIRTGFAEVRSDIRELKTGQSELRTDVNELKVGQAQLRTDVNELKVGQAQLRTDVNELKTDVTALKTDVTELREGQVQLNSKMDRVLEKLELA